MKTDLYFFIPIAIAIFAFLAAFLAPLGIYLYKLWRLNRQFDKTLKELNKRVKKERERTNEIFRKSLIKLEERDVNLDGEE